MAKHILLVMTALSLLAAPRSLQAAPEPAVAEISAVCDAEEVHLSVTGSAIRVQNAAGRTLEVYNITGVKVLSVTVDASDKTIRLSLPAGCYIVKVDKVVRKVTIR
ncbi:MAG: T9SS type A sorting domain-containing protein [Alloprevotella sp.]